MKAVEEKTIEFKEGNFYGRTYLGILPFNYRLRPYFRGASIEETKDIKIGKIKSTNDNVDYNYCMKSITITYTIKSN